MKKFAVLLAVMAVAGTGHAGQTNHIDLSRSAPAAPPPATPAPANGNALVAPRTNSTQRVFREEKIYGGALTDLRRQKTQFFRAPPGTPNAPFHNVSVDPITGRADGIILFSIGF